MGVESTVVGVDCSTRYYLTFCPLAIVVGRDGKVLFKTDHISIESIDFSVVEMNNYITNVGYVKDLRERLKGLIYKMVKWLEINVKLSVLGF